MYTVCSQSLVHFYIVSNYMILGKTYWTYSTFILETTCKAWMRLCSLHGNHIRWEPRMGCARVEKFYNLSCLRHLFRSRAVAVKLIFRKVLFFFTLAQDVLSYHLI